MPTSKTEELRDQLETLVLKYKMSDFMQGQNGMNTDYGDDIDKRVGEFEVFTKEACRRELLNVKNMIATGNSLQDLNDEIRERLAELTSPTNERLEE